MKIRIFSFLILILSAGSLFGQQKPLVSQYMFNHLLINPAFAGNKLAIEGIVHHKSQFMGFDGAPRTQILSVQGPIASKYIGLGLQLMTESIGPFRATEVSGNYAYQLGLGPGRLSLGLETMLFNYKVDFASLEKFNQEDQALAVEADGITKLDFGFGAFYDTETYYGGISILNLIQSKLQFTDFERDDIANLSRHMYILGGYVYNINDDIRIVPNVLVKYVKGAPMQLDINSLLTYKNMFSFGPSFRTGDAIALITRISLMEKYSLGYSYDIGISKFASHHGGSHEITLAYTHKLKAPPRNKTIHPRYYY